MGGGEPNTCKTSINVIRWYHMKQDMNNMEDNIPPAFAESVDRYLNPLEYEE